MYADVQQSPSTNHMNRQWLKVVKISGCRYYREQHKNQITDSQRTSEQSLQACFSSCHFNAVQRDCGAVQWTTLWERETSMEAHTWKQWLGRTEQTVHLRDLTACETWRGSLGKATLFQKRRGKKPLGTAKGKRRQTTLSSCYIKKN